MRTSYFVCKRIKITVASLLVFSTISCKKFVQIGAPDTLLVTANVFNNNNTATSALTSIYTQMFSNSESFNIAENLGLLADELKNYSTQVTQVQFYTNAMIATNSNGEWTNAYNYIYQANAIIEAMENNSNITPAVAQQLTGEAKFVRAFWHFYLTNEYGAVPIVTTTLYTVNEKASRSPQVQVYTQIIQDLKDAESELNSNFIDASDTTVTTERTRPCTAAAEALLARVYLYTQKYDSAETQASLVIANPLFSICSIDSASPNTPFLMNSTEAIWQLATPLPTSSNTIDAQNFILFGAPSVGYARSVTISSQLLNSFEPNDYRRAYWIDSFPKGQSTVSYYYPYKYQAYNLGSTDAVTEYTTVFRLAEQFLIRAEAEANLGDSSDAIADLNTIRIRAHLAPYSTVVNGPLLSAILHERQVELFVEWGHRWFDLIRTGNINSVLGSPGNVCQTKGGVWSPDSQLFPVPQSERLIDFNLTQNPGY